MAGALAYIRGHHGKRTYAAVLRLVTDAISKLRKHRRTAARTAISLRISHESANISFTIVVCQHTVHYICLFHHINWLSIAVNAFRHSKNEFFSENLHVEQSPGSG